MYVEMVQDIVQPSVFFFCTRWLKFSLHIRIESPDKMGNYKQLKKAQYQPMD